jgi:SAM-dependent methyltransferase
MGTPGPIIGDDLLWRHLKELPAFRALLRAVEARFYQDVLPLHKPVLDVGCGDGHFAAATFPSPLTAGIDPGVGVLREAQSRAIYDMVAQAQGAALPFPDGHFATVVSNSVLEHIPNLDPVLAEISRILQPGGRFIFTVPGDHFAKLLLFTELFRRLRLERMAQAYERFFNRVSRHAHCDDAQHWQARLDAHRFRVDRCFTYFSARAHHALDLGHYLGAPSLIAKKLTGRWIIMPTRWNLALTERILRPLYEEPLPAMGAYLFFVAIREDVPSAGASRR